MKTPAVLPNRLGPVMVATFVSNYVFTTYLKVRQIIKMRTENWPKYSTPEEFESTKAYNLDKLYFSIAEGLVKVVIECAVVIYGVLPRTLAKFEHPASVTSQTLFYILYSFVSSVIDIPFELFDRFYIEAKHKFNTMILSTFVLDFVKNTVISSIFAFIALSFVLWAMEKFKTFYIYAFVFLAAFQLLMVLIYPDYIQPLFNKFVELEESPLKEEIKKLAYKLKFHVSKIYKMDGSTRSHHSNAYFIGLFKEKRIVLFDTLLEKTDDKQMMGVLCHEFGHAKLLHIPKNLAITLLAEFVYLYIFNLSVNLIKSQNIIKIMYFMFLSMIADIPLKLLANLMSRSWERDADGFAVRMGYGKDLGSALIKLHQDNKSVMFPDEWYSTFTHSHPTLGERLDYIEKMMKKGE